MALQARADAGVERTRTHAFSRVRGRCRNRNATRRDAGHCKRRSRGMTFNRSITSRRTPRLSDAETRSLARPNHYGKQQRRRYGARSVLRLRHDHRVGAETKAPMDWDRHHEPRHQPDSPPTHRRLRRRHAKTYEVIGEPVSVADAGTLAASDPYQFQWWALGLVGHVQPKGRKARTKGSTAGSTSTKVTPARPTDHFLGQGREAPRTLCPRSRGVVEREKAAIGVLITLDEPTRRCGRKRPRRASTRRRGASIRDCRS